MTDFTFVTDISLCMNDLNMWLQFKDQLVHNLFGHFIAFVASFKLWEAQFARKELTYIKLIAESNCSSPDKYTTKLAMLRSEFKERFIDFRKPFTVNIANCDQVFSFPLRKV